MRKKRERNKKERKKIKKERKVNKPVHAKKGVSVLPKKKELHVEEDKKKRENVQLKIEQHEEKVEKESEEKGKVLESYDITVDGAKANIKIKKMDRAIVYSLNIPEINPATATFLKEIRNELISVTSISMKELTDPSLFSSIKQKFMRDAKKLFKERLPKLEPDVETFLVGVLMQEMLGLGKIEFLVADPHLEEIVIPSAKEPIRVYSKKYGWLISDFRIKNEEEIINYANIIARRVGRQITVLNPLLDAHLVSGDRINAVLYPVNTKGNTITIRKFARDPFTMIDFIENKTCDLDVAALLWLAIEFEMNVLISGGTGSGKTSFLNACMPFIPPNQRIISIEDTRELMLPEFLYWAPLVTRTSNPEGKGEVSMLDLLINSLRMRPDRIVLGEMRKQQEAMVLFEAMHTGHSVYSTVHADSAAETISRLVNPPLNVPPNLLKAVNLNVVMFRDRKKGIRRVMQVAEFEAAKEGASSNILYRWVPDSDSLVKHSTSSRFFEDISRNTGLSQANVAKELQEKKDILNWLVKNHIRSLGEFGKVTNFYYRDKESLLSLIKKGNKSAILRG
jgi:archaeal flagellar protein FlaI